MGLCGSCALCSLRLVFAPRLCLDWVRVGFWTRRRSLGRREGKKRSLRRLFSRSGLVVRSLGLLGARQGVLRMDYVGVVWGVRLFGQCRSLGRRYRIGLVG